jgi:hypothetical protein
MKFTMALTAVAVLGLAACETMTGPITDGNFDPLQVPGSNTTTVSTGPSYKAGQFVRTSMDNTAFFKTRPKGDADADKLLTRDTSMKVISISGTYVKVELDSGEVGFVPSIMVEDPSTTANPVLTANPGEFQVYPPLSTDFQTPLPIIDPAGLPPEGAIPTVIDPEAPATQIPATPVPVPAVEENVPLPPNTEDLEALKKTPEATPKVEADPSDGQ